MHDCTLRCIISGISCYPSNSSDRVAIENGKCGICMDDVIDRGVLDCCNHWFCFTCIDNWATITNFCPLCKNEFQLITCIPVYDTIGSLKGEECTISRDDDWCVQGRNNTLSFPSYYIDEDAVACLGDDDCKIRNGQLTAEGSLFLDTSIACDSCDVWCNVAESLDKSDSISREKPKKNCSSEAISSLSPTETVLCGKLSVSVADAGETAVVVSLVEGKQLTDDGQNAATEILSDVQEKHDETLPIVLGTTVCEKFVPRPTLCFLDGYGQSNLQSCSSISTPTTDLPNAFSCKEQGNSHEMEMSFPADGQGPSFSLPLPEDLLLLSCSKSSENPEGESEQNIGKTPDPNFGASTVQDRQTLAPESGIDLNPGLMAEPCFPAHEKTGKADEFAESSQKDLDDAGVNGKCMDESSDVMQLNDRKGHNQTLEECETRAIHKKRTISEGNSEMLKRKSEDDASRLGSSERYSKQATLLKRKRARKTSLKEDNLSEIMSLVKEVGPENLHELANPIRGARATKTKENAAGLRIKKIMRRGIEDCEASELVQTIKKEVEDAVNNGTVKTSSKGNLLDLKLLTAFRAAIAKPKEGDRKGFASFVKAKQSLLQKGKVRENLTRKLYGTASGRRRRAWDRDWEIDFWKHRCLHTKPEKVETLQSVLELLRKNPETWSMELKIENKCDKEETNPILSRLYLADASVLPRKEDLMPLSALTSNKDRLEKMDDSKNVSEQTGVASTKMHKQSSAALSHGTFSPSNARVSDKAHVGLAAQRLETSSTSSSHDSRIMKEAEAATGDVKADKRKWALAVLARKTAMFNGDKSGEKLVDEHYLQGNFPLLAQLPADMRPILAPSRQSKVPTSIRQVQLNRLVEHYLKKANLPSIYKCAETELAVADALNVEKQIHGRSKSRIVYLNLCSQAISQHVTVGTKSREEEAPSDCLVKVMDGSCDEASSSYELDSVKQALRLAGLLSESPPDSPYRPSEDTDGKSDPTVERGDKVCEDVLNLEPHPEVDIYGDFDYDLDEDFMGLSNINSSVIMSRTQLGVSTDSKVKVVLSTVNHVKDTVVTESIDAGTVIRLESEKVDKISISEGSLDCVPLVKPEANHDDLELAVPCDDEGCSNSLLNRENADPNEASNDLPVAEYEELYGTVEPEIIYGNESAENTNRCMIKQDAGEEIGHEKNHKCEQNNLELIIQKGNECYAENNVIEIGGPINGRISRADNSPTNSMMSECAQKKCEVSDQQMDQSPIHKKVEAYIKEHIRPLCKSGVITVEQYRWAVSKTTDKVMHYHYKAKNADFLIKEGPKVRKLAEQYVESAKQRCSRPSSLHGN
ncbi:unnamed protein product [Victoria cruziana]